jgi:hypothetical protein
MLKVTCKTDWPTALLAYSATGLQRYWPTALLAYSAALAYSATGLIRVKSQKSCLHLEHQCGKQEDAPPQAPLTRWVGLLDESKNNFGLSNVGAIILEPSEKITSLPYGCS